MLVLYKPFLVRNFYFHQEQVIVTKFGGGEVTIVYLVSKREIN